MNYNTIPPYLRKGRLVPLSKQKGTGVVTIGDIRLFVVLSHISKVMEKAILAKIQAG